jgi:Protein of unknown function DUF262
VPRPKKQPQQVELLDDSELSPQAVDRQTEGEDDLDATGLQRLSEAVVSGSDWTTETILRQLERGNIVLDPDFQRRDAWRRARKSRFIESLILSLPIPQLVLAENKLRKGTFLVIDGKQRLLTLRQFASAAGDSEYPQLRLEGLQVRRDLNGHSLESLRATVARAEDVTVFENQTIRTVVIKNWPNDSVLYLIFLRLNTGSVQLSPQELRRALHPGPFMKFADEAASKMRGLQRILRISKPDFRMRDVELLIRQLAFRTYLPEYRGNLKAFLDFVCDALNSAWATQERVLRSQADDVDKAISATYEIFGDEAFRKWNGSKYERRFNRAIYDVMTFYFAITEIRDAAARHHKALEEDFRVLCENPDFVKSIEVTTKSISATVLRLNLWGMY